MAMTPEDRFKAMLRKDCWIWQGARRWDGYGRLTFKGKQTTANRVAWELANGRPVPPGMHVLHSCDLPICCNPAHLSIGTHEQNMEDMRKKDRRARGERSIHAKLTEEEVLQIRALYKKTGPNRGNGKELSAKFGVSRGIIYAVAQGRTWKHLIVPSDRKGVQK